MLIDSHCHLTYPDLAAQIDAIVQRAHDAGVRRMLTIAETPLDAQAALKLISGRPGLYLAAGIHPHNAAKCDQDDLSALADLHRGLNLAAELRQRIVAVGEIGLDFHYDFAPRDRQEEVFRYQLDLALQAERPVVVHARSAEQRVCDILADFPALAERVVFHCYSGDEHVTRRILDLGFWLSFTGVVTFKKADTVRAAARLVPRDRIMIETDAPYLSPVPVRNRRPCEPAFVAHTARYLADLRAQSLAEFAATTTANTCRFFGLPEVNT
ncbi:MAG: TatD family hydrolase [Planctomycetes bacterium]|nr:TatD family hydrolase [Planctomycetota bacterium]